MKKRIVITGANGFLGKCLSRWHLQKGYEVVGLSRHGGVEEGVKCLEWDGESLGPWKDELEGAEAVVNLAGRSVNCRYGEKNRKLIFGTRENSTRVIGEAIQGCERPPKVWLNSSTATIYRHAEDGPQDEVEGEIGTGFSVEVAKAWEKAFFESEVPDEVRKVALRSSIVLANEDGTVFDYLFKLSRLGLGGTMGTGRQKVSWIHIEDFCRAIDWLIEKEQTEDLYNLVAPGVIDNREFMAEFRKIAGCRFGLPAAKWMLEIGAFFMRTETELILKSRWVKGTRLKNEGFEFRWPEFSAALENLKIHSG